MWSSVILGYSQAALLESKLGMTKSINMSRHTVPVGHHHPACQVADHCQGCIQWPRHAAISHDRHITQPVKCKRRSAHFNQYHQWCPPQPVKCKRKSAHFTHNTVHTHSLCRAVGKHTYRNKYAKSYVTLCCKSDVQLWDHQRNSCI